jgi:hypothetical protein
MAMVDLNKPHHHLKKMCFMDCGLNCHGLAMKLLQNLYGYCGFVCCLLLVVSYMCL